MTSLGRHYTQEGGNRHEEEDVLVIRGIVLDAKGLPVSGEITLLRKISKEHPGTLRFGDLEAPWRDPDSPKYLFLEIEGELKDSKFHILNPKTKTDKNGRFTLRVERSFLGDVKECTLAVGISSPSGGIIPQQIPHSGEELLVFQCPDRTPAELDLGEIRIH